MPTASRVRRRRLLVVGLGAALLVPLSMGPAGAQSPAGSAPASGTTVVGKVVRAYSDPTLAHAQGKGKRAQALTWIQPARGAAVRVPTGQVTHLPVGATVKATVGGAVTDAASTQDGLQAAHQVLASSVVAPATTPPTAAASTPPYTDTVTVVKVHPAGDPTRDPANPTSDTTDHMLISTLVDQVSGPVADYWESQTRGAVHLTAVPSNQADNWVTSTADCSTPQSMFSDVASQVGWTAGTGKHLLLYISEDLSVDCGDGLGDVSASMTDGGIAYVKGQAGAPDLLTSVITHELGHNFGLGHSGEQECDKSIEYGTCGIDSYADMYDVMGYSTSQMGALNAQQAALVGGLPSGEQQDLRGVAGTTTVTLSPMGTTGGTRSVTLLGPGGVEYWLEYRSAVGQDVWLGDPSTNEPALEQGVLLHIAGGGRYGDTSLLLDATPSPQSGWDTDYQTALQAGRSVWLSGLDYYLTVKSTSATSATVRIQAGDAALSRDLDRDYLADFVMADSSGTLYLYRANGSGGFDPRVVIGHGWQSRDAITMAGDFDGTGNSQDLIARNPSTGDLWLYSGNGHGGFTGARVIGHGWQVMNAIFSPGDWDGDGLPDLVARRRSDGALFLYSGNGAGGFKAGAVKIGNGWNIVTALVPTGDMDGDGSPDFVARTSDGTLYLYRGDGHGGFLDRAVVARNWNAATSITGVGDWNQDGAVDLIVRKADGTLWLYPGVGGGHFGTASKIGAGWNGVRIGT